MGLAGRRPTLGTDAGTELQTRLVAFLRAGNYISTACAALGMSEAAFYAWRERGEADLEAELVTPFSEFAEACARARAEGKAMVLQSIRQAGMGSEDRSGDWKALAWFLERSFPDEYGQRREVKHSGAVARTAAPEVPENEERLLTVAQLMHEIGVVPDEAR